MFLTSRDAILPGTTDKDRTDGRQPLRSDGGRVVMEINPGGQFGWLQVHTGLPMTETLADVLMRGH